MIQIQLIGFMFVVSAIATVYFIFKRPNNYNISTTSKSKQILQAIDIFNIRNYQPILFVTPEPITFKLVEKNSTQFYIYETDSPLPPLLVIQPNFTTNILEQTKRLAKTSGRTIYVILGGYDFEVNKTIQEVESMLDIINQPIYIVCYGTASNRIIKSVIQQRFGSVIKIFCCFCSFDSLAPMFWSQKVMEKEGILLQNWLKLNGQTLVNNKIMTAFEFKQIYQNPNIVSFDTLICRNLDLNIEDYYIDNCPIDSLDNLQNEIIFINSKSDYRTGRVFPDEIGLGANTQLLINCGNYMECFIKNGQDVTSVIISLLIENQ